MKVTPSGDAMVGKAETPSDCVPERKKAVSVGPEVEDDEGVQLDAEELKTAPLVDPGPGAHDAQAERPPKLYEFEAHAEHPAALEPGLCGEPQKPAPHREQALAVALPAEDVVVPCGHGVQEPTVPTTA